MDVEMIRWIEPVFNLMDYNFQSGHLTPTNM